MLREESSSRARFLFASEFLLIISSLPWTHLLVEHLLSSSDFIRRCHVTILGTCKDGSFLCHITMFGNCTDGSFRSKHVV